MPPSARFDGETVLITGVGREGQLGDALALTFAQGGARLALVDRTPAEVEARAAALRARGHEAHAFACDLTSPASVDAAFARVRDAVGPALDALVCAAGGFAATGPLDAEPDGAAALDAFQRQLAINLTTAYLATRGALPLLRAPGRRPTGGDGTAARIVYVASAAVLPDGDPAGLAAYAAAKAGVLALMRAVAADERPRGDGAAGRRAVRANAVAPTAIRTAANAAAGMDPATAVTREAVAGTVAWLGASTSAPVTGQVLRLG